MSENDKAAWNFAQDYYEILKAVIVQATEAYSENDVREFWKWIVWLYDNVRMQFSKANQKLFDDAEIIIEDMIYKSSLGDKVSSLYDASFEDVEENQKQMRAIRHFYRNLTAEMQRKGMIIPTSKSYVPGTAVLSYS